MDHIDSVTSGIQPFLFGDVTPEESQQMSAIYQMVMAGNAAPNLTDAAALMSPSKPNLPKVLFQAREMLQRLLIVYNVLLGEQHDLSTNLARFLQDFMDRESFLHYYQPITPGYQLCMPLLIIQWLTLRIDAWYRDQAVSDEVVPAPNFGLLFRQIDYREQWEPYLHPTLLQEYQHQTPGQQLLGAQGRNGGNEDNGQRGNRAGGTTQVDTNEPPNQVVRNPNYKVALFGRFRAMNINHRQLRQAPHYTTPPISPFSTTNGEMCISYHAKGLCNQRCSRAYDHQPHTDEQDQALVTWMEANYHL